MSKKPEASGMSSVESQKTLSQRVNEPASVTDDVRGAEYYHGLVPKLEAEESLKKEGDFLLRKTEDKQGRVVLCLSVRVDEKQVKHFALNLDPDGGGFYFEGHREKNIPDLVAWHITTKTAITTASNAKIRRPIERTQWLINHDSVLITKQIGEGAFGQVFLADYEVGKAKQQVAVKTMRAQMTRDNRLKFMKEARIMRKYQHKHVVKIMGVAVHEQPLMIVMEFCPNGSLKHYLRKNKGKTEKAEKLRFSMESADGLSYLHRQKCIHRDIAARNCLLGNKNDIKISDFGMSEAMSKDNDKMQDQTLEKVPVKWLAPETLQYKVYSFKSDVWAYSILIWEIYADGADPYPGLANVQARAKIVVNDHRMEFPECTPKEVVEIVKTCWEKSADNRPVMATVFDKLKAISEKK